MSSCARASFVLVCRLDARFEVLMRAQLLLLTSILIACSGTKGPSMADASGIDASCQCDSGSADADESVDAPFDVLDAGDTPECPASSIHACGRSCGECPEWTGPTAQTFVCEPETDDHWSRCAVSVSQIPRRVSCDTLCGESGYECTDHTVATYELTILRVPCDEVPLAMFAGETYQYLSCTCVAQPPATP